MDDKKERDITLAVPKISEISNSYKEDFLGEIMDILTDIELELVNIEVDPGNKESLNSIDCSLHTIRGLSGLLNNTACTKITVATEELLETVRKYCPVTSKTIINLVLDSIAFIKKLNNNPELINDSMFNGEIGRHLVNMSNTKEDILLEVRNPMVRDSRIGEILVH